MKKSYKLLIYDAMGRRYGRQVLAVMAGTLLSGLAAFWVEFLFEWRFLLVCLALLLALVWSYFGFWMRSSAVYLEKRGLRFQGPLRSMIIPYGYILSVLPERLSDHFSLEDLGNAQLDEFKQFYNVPALFLALHEDGLPDPGSRRWFTPLLFSGKKQGLVVILEEWVEFARAIEKIRKGIEPPPPKKTFLAGSRSVTPGQIIGPSGKPLILIADENRGRIKTYERLLLKDYQLVFGSDGPDALRLARKYRPDLIIADHYLDQLDGLQVTVSLRRSSQCKSTPILFLTDSYFPEAFDAGASDILKRPIDDHDFRARIAHQLRQLEIAREMARMTDQLESQTLNQMAELVRRGELINFLPESVARNILSGHLINPWANHQRQKVTVLFVDLVGFTPLTSRLNPELLSELVNDFLREMTAVSLGNHGTVDKFIGDEVMVLFGAPEPQPAEVQALHAATTAVEMLYAVKQMSLRWKPRLPQGLQVRIGFNTGFGTTGIFGDELLRSYTVVGPVVNIAARLRAAAKPGQIVCSAESFALLESHFQAEPLGSLSLKGLEKPVEAFSLANQMFPEAMKLG